MPHPEFTLQNHTPFRLATISRCHTLQASPIAPRTSLLPCRSVPGRLGIDKKRHSPYASTPFWETENNPKFDPTRWSALPPVTGNADRPPPATCRLTRSNASRKQGSIPNEDQITRRAVDNVRLARYEQSRLLCADGADIDAGPFGIAAPRGIEVMLAIGQELRPDASVNSRRDASSSRRGVAGPPEAETRYKGTSLRS